MKILRQCDNFDRANLIIIAGIVILMAAMIINQKRVVNSAIVNPKSISPVQNKTLKEADQKLYKMVFEQEDKGDIKRALVEIDKIINSQPDHAQSWVYQARLYKKQAILSKSSHSYRMALEADSKFLHKQYYLFIADEVMELILSAIPKFKREKKLKPNDTDVKRTLRDLYYLRRKVAGGCE